MDKEIEMNKSIELKIIQQREHKNLPPAREIQNFKCDKKYKKSREKIQWKMKKRNEKKLYVYENYCWKLVEKSMK